jgi:hypothetical protein
MRRHYARVRSCLLASLTRQLPVFPAPVFQTAGSPRWYQLPPHWAADAWYWPLHLSPSSDDPADLTVRRTRLSTFELPTPELSARRSAEPRCVEPLHPLLPAPRHEVRPPPLQLLRSEKNLTSAACMATTCTCHSQHAGAPVPEASSCACVVPLLTPLLLPPHCLLLQLLEHQVVVTTTMGDTRSGIGESGWDRWSEMQSPGLHSSAQAPDG